AIREANMVKRLAIVLAAGLVIIPIARDACSAGAQEKTTSTVKADENEKFADNLLEIMALIGHNHVVPASRADMMNWAVDELFRAVKEPVPAETTRKLKGVENASRAERAALLKEIRKQLGQRKELADDLDMEVCVQSILDHLQPGLPEEDRNWYKRKSE